MEVEYTIRIIDNPNYSVFKPDSAHNVIAIYKIHVYYNESVVEGFFIRNNLKGTVVYDLKMLQSVDASIIDDIISKLQTLGYTNISYYTADEWHAKYIKSS